jgi:hypothetical protein
MKPPPYITSPLSRTIRADQPRDINGQSEPDVREDIAIQAYRGAPQAALDRWETDGGHASDFAASVTPPAPSAAWDSGSDSGYK